MRWFPPLMIAAGFAMALTAPIELLYAGGFAQGAAALGVFMLTTAIGMTAVDVLGTRVVPHLDARGMLIGGILVFGASCAVMAVAPTFGFLLAGRVVQGLGAGLLMGAGLQAAVRVTPGHEEALGSFNSAFLFGAALGAPVGGIIAGLLPGQSGYRLTFLCCTVCCVSVALALAVSLPPLVATSRGRARIAFPRVDGRPGLLPALLLGTLGDFVRGGVVYTALPLVGADRQFPVATIGLAVGVLSGVEIVMLRAAPRLLARFGIVPCLVSCLAVGVACSLVLASTRGLAAYLVSSVVFGLVVAGATIGPPLLILALADEPAAALATFRISAGIGMLVGTTTAGVVAGAFGATGVFGLVGVVLVGGITLSFVVGRRVAALNTA